MRSCSVIVLTLLATPVWADDTRHLDAHEHGVGTLNIAIEGTTVAMEFHAPGADIVGFEYVAERAEDRAAIDAAVATLAKPLELFVMPADARCTVVQASAELESEDMGTVHEHHDEHHDDEHHDEAHHNEEHHNEEHHEEGHHEEGHHEEGHHDEAHAHGEHHHEDGHEDLAASGHTEFHAEYTLNCGDPKALTSIGFAYFDTFENALEVNVQIVSADGAKAFEVRRADPQIDLRGMF